MAGRKIRDAQEARNCLTEVAKSGERRAQWARARGIDPRSLNAWRVNLERSTCTAPSMPRLVELVPKATIAACVAVRCGPFTVEVGESFDEHLLARVLTVVASC